MPERRSLILTGFMGAGKSSVGRVLAERCIRPLYDLDAEIVREAGCPISDIFAGQGEAAFRALESTMLERVLAGPPCVLATGGGAVLSPANREVMRRHGRIVNLIVSLPDVLQRLAGDTERPLYAGSDAAERVAALMAAREQCYADADIRIDTHGKSVEDVAAEILRELREIA